MAVTAVEPHTLPRQHARVLWQLALDAEIRVPPMALADGLMIALDRGRRTLLRRVDLETATDVWRATLDHRAVAAPVRTGTLLAVPLTNGEIAALDVRDGQPRATRWSPVDQALHSPIAALGGGVYARWGLDVTAQLGCFREDEARPAWVVDDPLGGADWAYYRKTAGLLLVAGTHAERGLVVSALEPETGETRWTFEDADAACQHLWALGGIIDVVSRSSVIGIDIATGQLRSTRFAGFPLDSARIVGGHLVTMMDGHMGPVLLSFEAVSQTLRGRVNRAMATLVGAHADEVLVTLVAGEPAFYTVPALEPIALPEADQVGTPRFVAFSRDVAYIVADDGRMITAVDLDCAR